MKHSGNREKKIVFFDIDGTILDRNNKIPVSTKEAIRLLKLNGVHVAIATGRAPTIFKTIRDELEVDSYVCCNGSYVVFKGEAIYKHAFEATEIKKLQKMAFENKHPMVFANDEFFWTNTENHPHIQRCMTDLNVSYPSHQLKPQDNQDIFYTLLFCEDHDEVTYRAAHNWFDFIRWHKYSMDVIPSGSSKAKGIQAMLSRLGISKENSYAFGDGINDLEMLEYVGTGIAMGNGVAQVKEIADMITKDVSNEGIYYGLKKVGLI
jgi:Cof subfamily protein (haloacid dehalogenase superfamily)